MKISGRNGSKKKLGGTNMLNYSSELGKLSEESGSRLDSAMGLKAIAYNLMVVSNMKSGEKAREIKKIVVC